jgi:hypothetical protein
MMSRRGALAILLAVLPPCRPAVCQTPRHYVAPFTPRAPAIDGRLDDRAWAAAPWSDDFVDIEGDAKPAPRLRTRVRMLWDSTALYIAAELAEPDLWATITQRDAVIFRDNDFEVFLDPDGNARTYFELEINALGTVWDLFLPVAYRDGGHARNEWNITGLRWAVHLAGTLNQPADRDSGWTVELAIPIRDLATPEVTTAVPRVGDVWRVNFSRVEWDLRAEGEGYVKVTDPTTGRPRAEHNWVWSPQGMVDMHQPERWGFVEFGPTSRRRR